MTGSSIQVDEIILGANGASITSPPWDILDTKWSFRKFAPSVTSPWFRADQDQNLLGTNWSSDLITELRGTKIEIGGISQFPVQTYSVGSICRIQLTDILTNRNLIRALLEDYRFSKSYNPSLNSDVADDSTTFSNWGFLVRVSSTFVGSGIRTPTLGEEFLIKFNSNIASTIDPINRFLSVDKDTTGVTGIASGGTIELYPYRIVGSTTSAKWRKISEAGLMTPGSTFYSGTDLVEVPANLRVRDRIQGHDRRLFAGGANSNVDEATFLPGDNSSFAKRTSQFLSDSLNGDPRIGPNTRERAGVGYLYVYGKSYTP